MGAINSRDHDELLTRLERQHQVWELKFMRDYAELRGLLVDTYGEEPMKRKEQQLKELHDG